MPAPPMVSNATVSMPPTLLVIRPSASMTRKLHSAAATPAAITRRRLLWRLRIAAASVPEHSVQLSSCTISLV